MVLNMYEIIDECLKDKNCKSCNGCPADKIAWEKIEKSFADGSTPSNVDLELYYKIKAKYEIYLDETFERTTRIGFSVMPSLLRRYGG